MDEWLRAHGYRATVSDGGHDLFGRQLIKVTLSPATSVATSLGGVAAVTVLTAGVGVAGMFLAADAYGRIGAKTIRTAEAKFYGAPLSSYLMTEARRHKEFSFRFLLLNLGAYLLIGSLILIPLYLALGPVSLAAWPFVLLAAGLVSNVTLLPRIARLLEKPEIRELRAFNKRDFDRAMRLRAHRPLLEGLARTTPELFSGLLQVRGRLLGVQVAGATVSVAIAADGGAAIAPDVTHARFPDPDRRDVYENLLFASGSDVRPGSHTDVALREMIGGLATSVPKDDARSATRTLRALAASDVQPTVSIRGLPVVPGLVTLIAISFDDEAHWQTVFPLALVLSLSAMLAYPDS